METNKISQMRSKVMKAAWTSFRSGKSKTWSESLRSAWAWAKRTLVEKFRSIMTIRESEKAVAINVYFECVHTERTVTRMAWIPKSLLHNGCVPEWFLTKKVNELAEQFSGYNSRLNWYIN